LFSFKFILETAQSKGKLPSLIETLIRRRDFGELANSYKRFLIRFLCTKEAICDRIINCIKSSFFNNEQKTMFVSFLLRSGREDEALNFFHPRAVYSIQIAFAKDAPKDLLPLLLDLQNEMALSIIEKRMSASANDK